MESKKLIVYRGNPFYNLQPCGSECIKCGRPIVFNLPGSPKSMTPGFDLKLQFIHKSTCSCGFEFYTMTTPSGQALLGTGYECSTKGVSLTGTLNIEFRDGFQEFLNPDVLRIQSEPLVVERGSDDKFRLKRM